MPETMQAARLHTPGEPLNVEEVPVPRVGSDDVLIKVLRSAFNGGDYHLRNGDYSDHYIPPLPIVVSHDGVGEVVKVGDNVNELIPGDRVTIVPRLQCGQCVYCQDTQGGICEYYTVMGFRISGSPNNTRLERLKDGFMAEYSVVPATNAIKLKPDDVIDEVILSQRMAVGHQALRKAGVTPGDTVIVNGGTGPTGVGTVLAALAAGAATVIVVARNRKRLEYVESINHNRITTISTKDGSVRDQIKACTDAPGPAVLADLTPGGVESTIDCLESLRHGGSAVLVGGNQETLAVEYRHMYRYYPTLTFSKGFYANDKRNVLELHRNGVIDLTVIGTNYFELEEVNEALESLRSPGEKPALPIVTFE